MDYLGLHPICVRFFEKCIGDLIWAMAEIDGTVSTDERRFAENLIARIGEKTSRYRHDNGGSHVGGADAESLQKVLAELDSLVGLASVKKSIRNAANFALVQQKRQEHGLKPIPISLHGALGSHLNF